MKKRSKFIAIILVIAICISCIGYEGDPIYAKENVQVKKFYEDGIEYTVTTSKNGNKTKAIIEYGDTKIETTRVNDTVTSTQYEDIGKNIFGNKKYKVVQKNTFDMDDFNQPSKNVKAEYTWNSKTKTPADWGSVYWYQYGTSSYNNAYLQIGCKAKYRLKYYKLSTKKKKECQAFTDKIKKCKQYYTTGSVGISGSTLGLLCGLIIASAVTIEIPVAAVVTAVVAVAGGYASSATALVKSYYSYLDVKDDYTIVKTYGTKL